MMNLSGGDVPPQRLLVTVVILVIIVQLIQEVFMRLAKKGDKRIR